MPRGGKRDGAGRKAGSANTKTREIADKAASEGITPLEFMLEIMRKEDLGPDADPAQLLAHQAMRFEAAKAAAPYVHPKLSAIDATLTGPNGGPLETVTRVELVPLRANGDSAD